MPKAKCPHCGTIVSYALGYDPICPHCGFRGEAPVKAAPARWGAVPEPGVPVPVAAATPVAYAVPAPVYAQARPQNGLANAGLTLGILGLALFWIPVIGPILALLGAALGGAGIAGAERDPQLAYSRGTAITGLALGLAGLVLAFLVWGDGGWDDGPFWWD